MAVQFNHTIVYVTDKAEVGAVLGQRLGLPERRAIWSFIIVETRPTASPSTSPTPRADRSISPQHYAFLVSEEDFDGIFAGIQSAGSTTGPTRASREPATINHNDGGRGVYLMDPDGHFLEAITRPYGS